jgi:hypothetical protein
MWMAMARHCVVSPHAADISGVIRNDKGETARAGTVTVVRVSDEVRVEGLLRSEMGGRFRITGLAPGEYRIFAWEQIPAFLADDSQFLKHFENAATVLKVDEDQHATADLKLISREAVQAETAKLN